MDDEPGPMTADEANEPAPTDAAPPADAPVLRSTSWWLWGVATWTGALALVLDVASRFVAADSLPRLSVLVTATSGSAAAFALLVGAAVRPPIGHRGTPEVGALSALGIIAVAMVTASLALRVHYWETDQGTPVRAIVPLALAVLTDQQALTRARAR